MYCPHCGQPSPEDRKFCKFCGTNLGVVSLALTQSAVPPKNLSEATTKILDDWFSHKPAPAPEERRLKDIRGGVITSFTGMGICIFLYFFFGAVASNPRVPSEAAMIIQRIWLAGLIPFFVGVGLILNGILFHKPTTQSFPPASRQPTRLAAPETQRGLSTPGVVIPPSVTEQTTHRLEPARQPPPERQREPDR
jgi:hypothetical protein